MLNRAHALALSITVLVLGCAAPALAADPEPPLALNRIAASMPTVDSVPDAGLKTRTSRLYGTARARAPYPCSDYTARGAISTSHWGEWEAKGSGNRVRVITFSYGDRRIDAAWSALTAGIEACPAVLPRTDTGGPGSTTQTIVSSTDAAVRFELTVRGPDGSRRVGEDRAIVYQRIGDAIQKIQVARVMLTDDDRNLLTRLAAISRTRYEAARDLGDQPADLSAMLGSAPLAWGPLLGDVGFPVTAARRELGAGQALNVSLGDSFISGEAGRWRGNVFWHLNSAKADAYGAEAYADTATGEAIRGCHRAKGAEIHVPGTVGLNLACSGAITTSKFGGNGDYKPGIDGGMVDPNTGAQLPGQLTLLEETARAARIGTIVLSIGGNDMGFSTVMGACVKAFMKPWPFTTTCAKDPAARDRLTDAALDEVGGKVEEAIVRIHATMQAAGYANGSWQMIVQNYPKPIAEDNRYPETYAGRIAGGGCPFYDSDIRWVNSRLPVLSDALRSAAQRAAARTGQPVRFLDLLDAFAGRELCAKGAAHVDRIPAGEITSKAERVQSMRVFAPWDGAEAVHPNQAGQQVLQACLREALNGGNARSGRCVAPADWSQLDETGLPRVRFTPAM